MAKELAWAGGFSCRSVIALCHQAGASAVRAGRVFGSAGDSIIVEFASPVDAVRSAAEMQLAIDGRNAGLPEPSRIRFRIGINLGDVVADGGNLMGDGVNVAARLEPARTATGSATAFSDFMIPDLICATPIVVSAPAAHSPVG